VKQDQDMTKLWSYSNAASFCFLMHHCKFTIA